MAPLVPIIAAVGSAVSAAAPAAAAVGSLAAAGVSIAQAAGAFGGPEGAAAGDTAQAEDEARRLQRQALARAGGRQSTILAGPGGVQQESLLARPSLSGSGGPGGI